MKYNARDLVPAYRTTVSECKEIAPCDGTYDRIKGDDLVKLAGDIDPLIVMDGGKNTISTNLKG